MKRKTFDELRFYDDYLFCKILTENLDLCKELLELILDIKIKEVRLPETQKELKFTYDTKGVRFDVYTEDSENSVYDIEMQTYVENALPKRMRYYQGMIDLSLIEKGEHYSKLKRSYVIFICSYDPFKKNLPVYTFKNICEQDNSVELKDEAIKVVINSQGDRNGLSPKMKDFLDYVGKNVAKGDFSKKLDLAVNQVKQDKKWRLEYMTLYEKLQIERREGRKEGLASGKAEMAIKLLSRGVCSEEEIIEISGLTMEEINKYKESIQ